MIRRAMLSFVLLCLWAFNVKADVPPPSHLKHVDPRLRFEGIEDYPDHVFFLRFYNVHGNPTGARPSLIELKSMEVFSIIARRVYHMEVLSMPRTEFDKRKADDPSLSWLKGEPLAGGENPDLPLGVRVPGVRYAKIQVPPTVASAYASETPLAEYRITLRHGRLGVDVVSMPEPNYTPPLERWLFWLFGAAALAGAGVWFARRRRMLGVRAHSRSEGEPTEA